ncbi:MAG: acetolactate synthase large subunit [Pigmentiphaga sp.]|uniref:acetolactate synthase large subunit n=1 Tax=Pigmentiphaga sp. TaxID=1977564 RepID=UPI0029B12D69|nr:acetolactate synthase large subunit [Pigmentiphaga sp.]MDX3904371.1 acetolactate synthase large subunit [Pigmentiphaga sp.]
MEHILATRTGASWLFESAADAGIDTCFANPGTTELPMVAAMEDVPRLRPVLCLFEGVCSGAADGYYRIAQRPAMTLTHLGPGFANAIANLHNARRAGSSILNVIGDHMTWHVDADPPLASDIASLAAPVSRAYYRADSVDALQRSVAAALDGVVDEEGGIHTLAMPMDIQTASIPHAPYHPPRGASSPRLDGAGLDIAARAIRAGRRVLLLLGGDALFEESLLHVGKLAGRANVFVMGETFPARSEHGRGLPAVGRLHPDARQAHEWLHGFDLVVLVGAARPVAFFGAEGVPSFLGDSEKFITLHAGSKGTVAALGALVEALGPAPAMPPSSAGLPDWRAREGRLTPETAALIVATHLPERAIVSAEGKTLAFPFNRLAHLANRHSTIVLTGGAIGQGIPAALGAAIAAPDRKVVGLQSDGSAMYTLQALWSIARTKSDVTICIAANQRYQILEDEMRRTGHALTNPAVTSLLDLADPGVDWAALAGSLGVEGMRVGTNDEMDRAFARAMREGGPKLIQLCLEA